MWLDLATVNVLTSTSGCARLVEQVHVAFCSVLISCALAPVALCNTQKSSAGSTSAQTCEMVHVMSYQDLYQHNLFDRMLP